MAELELLEKIEVYEKNYSEIMQKMAEAGKCNDIETIKECGKKIADLEEIIDLAKKYRTQLNAIEDARELIKNEKDEEMKDINEKIVQFYIPQHQFSSDIFYLLSKEKFALYIHHTFPEIGLKHFHHHQTLHRSIYPLLFFYLASTK